MNMDALFSAKGLAFPPTGELQDAPRGGAHFDFF
jgi:hypothetical protein